LGIAALLVLVASLWSAYSTLHGAKKFVAVLVSAGLGAIVLIWILSWVVAAAMARTRQRREAIRQRDGANDTINNMMNGVNDLQRIRGEQNNAIAVLIKERDSAIKERDDALDQLLVLHDPTRIEGLRVALDGLVRRGFELNGELAVMEPTATDDEGNGIAYDFFPRESKWEQVGEFTEEALALIRECDPGLLFTYATGFNSAQAKLRRRNDQLDKLHEKLPSYQQMHNMFERVHKRPADQLECVVDALVQVRDKL